MHAGTSACYTRKCARADHASERSALADADVSCHPRFSVPEPPVVVKWSVLELDDVVDADDFTPAQIAQLRKLGFEAIE